jgi:two-component system chemotaxis response regulator CheB
MIGHDIIVIGASAGGVEALIQLVQDIPAGLPASIFITLHVPAHSPSVLPKILNRKGNLTACHPTDGQRIERGRIYIAPPDHHLLIRPGGVMRLSVGPKENGHRPSIDPLFRSAAEVYGGRVIGVIITGTLDDGTAGLAAVKVMGGTTVVQDPADAMYAGMPRNAIENVDVDHIVPLADLGALLNDLSARSDSEPENPAEHELLNEESRIAELDTDMLHGRDHPGTPSEFACPDCGGVLWQISAEGFARYRCRTGHAFSGDSLLARQSDTLEEALWTAIRALEERANLSMRLAERMMKRQSTEFVQRLLNQADQAKRQAEIIRDVLIGSRGSNTDIDMANGTEAGTD